MVDKAFYRKLLRVYHKLRLKPYHIQDTLFLLSLRCPSIPSSRGSIRVPLAALFGVDEQCNPVDPSKNPPVDVAAVYQEGLTHIKTAMRSSVSLPASLPKGLVQFVRTIEEGKLFWLVRRLTNIAENPHRVPSAGSEGVHTSVLYSRPGIDTFPLVDMFLGISEHFVPAGSSGAPSFSSGNTKAVAFAKDQVPTSCTIDTDKCTMSMTVSLFEHKFTPAQKFDTETIMLHHGLPGTAAVTPHRFLFELTLESKDPLFHIVIVNSLMYELDVASQVLSEGVGSLVNPLQVPLLQRSEVLRSKITRGDVDVATKRSAPMTSSLNSGTRLITNKKQSWKSTWILNNDGPAVIKGVIYFKTVIDDDIKTEEELAIALASSPIESVTFGPLALKIQDAP